MDNLLPDALMRKSYPQVYSMCCSVRAGHITVIDVRTKGRSDSGDGVAGGTLSIAIRLDMGFV